MARPSKPRVLFAIGDADWKYTRGKFSRLVERVASEDRFQVGVVSHSEEICAACAASTTETFYLPGEPLALSAQDSTAMTELMIRLTRDIRFPDSRLNIWKVMAMDDYLGSINFVDRSRLPVRPDIVVCPLMGVDNNSSDASHLYSSMVLEAQKAHAPLVGLEVSLLGNKQTLAASLADLYALKSDRSREFIFSEELAAPDRAFVLQPEEAYLLTCRDDAYWDDYFTHETPLRRRLNVPRDRVVIFIPHHVAFVYEIRALLRHLKGLPFPFSVILRADPNIARQGLKEREIAEKVYVDEFNALPHVVVDDQGGWLWSLLLADVVLAPAHSVYTELAAAYGKLTVVCQGWGKSSWVGDNLYIEPQPERLRNAMCSWIERRVLPRRALSEIIAAALEHPRETGEMGLYHEA